MKNIKFTLLELFLSIACIVVISLIIIPFISKLFYATEKKVFTEFADLVYKNTQEASSKIEKENDTCYVYNIKKDLNLDDLGTFEGYTVVKENNIYLSIHNENYQVYELNYINKDSVFNSLITYDEKEYNIVDFLIKLECKNSEYVTK